MLAAPTTLVALAALALFALPGQGACLELDRAAFGAGEWWRAVTGHLVHFSFDHMVWDCLLLAALGAFVARADRTRLALALGVSTAAISAAVLLCLPEIETYRGASGLASTAFGFFAVAQGRAWYRERAALPLGLLAAAATAFGAKCGYELATGGAVFVDSGSAGFTAVPLAHAVGALIGAALALRR